VRVGDDGCGVMTTDVVKRTQRAIRAAHDDDRLTAGQLAGAVLTGHANVVEPRGNLPGSAEDSALLQLEDARVHIPGRRNCRCMRERRLRLVTPDDLLE